MLGHKNPTCSIALICGSRNRDAGQVNISHV